MSNPPPTQHGPTCPCPACQKRLAEWGREEDEQRREQERAWWQRQARKPKDK